MQLWVFESLNQRAKHGWRLQAYVASWHLSGLSLPGSLSPYSDFKIYKRCLIILNKTPQKEEPKHLTGEMP
jgi:hypothetical protein